MESFGQYIRRLRTHNGFSQTQLAAKIGLDSAGLSKVENDKKHLKEDKLALLAKALKVDIIDIKTQYLSEKFAGDCSKYHCPETVFSLAEQKTRYYKMARAKQSSLNF